MSCRIFTNDKNGCFYDSVTNTVFFKLMNIEELKEFEKWLNKDARSYNHYELEKELEKMRIERKNEK